MKRYPVYKDSGVEWLGYLPEHWTVKKLKFVANVQPSNVDKKTLDDEIPVLLCNYSDVYKNEWITNEIEFMKASATQEEIIKFSLQKGDLIITKDSENPYDIAVPALVIEDLKNVLCGYHLTQIRSKKIDGNFLLRLFQCKRFNGQFVVNANGVTRFGLPSRAINDAFIGFPPIEEQKAIAHFLDHKLEQIEQYIRNKQRLIELLNEQKTAIINRAVTKGINPNVPMKHSGIEWLGEIPAHWQLVKLGNLCWKVADGPHFSPSYLDEGIMFLSARNVKVDSWSLEDIKYISQKDYKEFCKRIIPETGDILYTKGGTTGIARVVDLEEPFQVWVHIAVLKLKKEKINPYLLAYILNGNACYQQSQLYTRGATNQDLGLTRMVNIVFAIPPSLEEQQYIVDYLKNEISKIALAIAQIEKEIELIQEYRTTLISDAVTGKIDVRGFDNGSNSKNSPKPPELATM